MKFLMKDPPFSVMPHLLIEVSDESIASKILKEEKKCANIGDEFKVGVITFIKPDREIIAMLDEIEGLSKTETAKEPEAFCLNAIEKRVCPPYCIRAKIALTLGFLLGLAIGFMACAAIAELHHRASASVEILK